MLTHSLRVSIPTKGELSQIKLSQNDEKIGLKCCRAHFGSVWEPLTRGLVKGGLK